MLTPGIKNHCRGAQLTNVRYRANVSYTPDDRLGSFSSIDPLPTPCGSLMLFCTFGTSGHLYLQCIGWSIGTLRPAEHRIFPLVQADARWPSGRSLCTASDRRRPACLCPRYPTAQYTARALSIILRCSSSWRPKVNTIRWPNAPFHGAASWARHPLRGLSFTAKSGSPVLVYPLHAGVYDQCYRGPIVRGGARAHKAAL